MKKVLAISLTVLMIICMSFSVCAATGEFVKSPSNNGAPTLVSGKCQAEGCDAELIITPFKNRDELPDELCDLIEKAYKEIANSKNIADLFPGLSAIAKNKDIPQANLAVSDLFDIRYIRCEEHSEHGYFDIVIESDTFKNFVALAHLSNDGWEIIDDAEVKEVDGEYHLTFSVDDFSPFAVVVDAGSVVDKNPPTGDNYNVYFYAALMAVSAFAVLILIKKNKKQAA